MNKYQEPLDCIKRFYVESEHYDEENIRLLQELVDKAIPKKPIINHICNEIEGDIDYGVCPICERPLGYAFNYCEECGQALDWSDEDDK